jgi:hypothetical protein
MTVKVKRASKDDWFKVGVHVVAPSKAKLQDAKEDAANKGFSIVWVHSANSLKTVKRR